MKHCTLAATDWQGRCIVADTGSRSSRAARYDLGGGFIDNNLIAPDGGWVDGQAETDGGWAVMDGKRWWYRRTGASSDSIFKDKSTPPPPKDSEPIKTAKGCGDACGRRRGKLLNHQRKCQKKKKECCTAVRLDLNTPPATSQLPTIDYRHPKPTNHNTATQSLRLSRVKEKLSHSTRAALGSTCWSCRHGGNTVGNKRKLPRGGLREG